MSRPCSVGQLAVTSLLGVAVLSFSVSFLFYFDALIRREAQVLIPLRNSSSSPSFRLWKNIPVPVKNSFYFFHVVNPLEVLKYGEAPELLESGPYVYLEHRQKVDVRFSDDGQIVSYREVSRYSFDEAASVGPETDRIRVLNVPLLLVLENTRDISFVTRVLLRSLIAQTGSSFFVRPTVKELLWGYEDPLLHDLKYIVHNAVSSAKFGWHLGRNWSDQGRLDVYTGQDGDLSRFLKVASWNGDQKLSVWPGKDCNRIRGTDGTAFQPFLGKEKPQYTFVPNMCRSIKSVFVGEEELLGLDTYRFELDDNVFANSSENACFCSPISSPCLPSGVLNISRCSKGAPFFVSQPHFLNADKVYVKAFKGLSPDPIDHSTFVNVEPFTGAAVKGAGRLQINTYVKRVPVYDDFYEGFPDSIVFPIFWLEQFAVLDAISISELMGKPLGQIRLVHAFEAMFLAVGVVLTLTALLLGVHRLYVVRKKPVKLIKVEISFE